MLMTVSEKPFYDGINPHTPRYAVRTEDGEYVGHVAHKSYRRNAYEACDSLSSALNRRGLRPVGGGFHYCWRTKADMLAALAAA